MYQLKITREITNIPSDKEVEKAEKALGFTFPTSYKKFVKTYGYGVLCGLFIVGVPKEINGVVDVEKRNKQSKEFIKEHVEMGLWSRPSKIPMPDTNWLLTLEPFGESENGDILCWDVHSPDENGEYPIYLLGDEQTIWTLAAKSLDEFIEEFCIKQKIDELFPVGQGQKWNLPDTFDPIK